MGWRWWLRVGMNETPRMNLDVLRRRYDQEAYRLMVAQIMLGVGAWARELVEALTPAMRAFAEAVSQLGRSLTPLVEAMADAGYAAPYQGPCPDPEYDPGPWLRGDQ